MVLVLNCMLDDELAASFDRAISRPLEKSGKQAEFVRVPGRIDLPDVSGYTHVIISGSEASALDDMPWDELLQETVEQIIEQQKPLLGICYGHQFLARVQAGKESVGRTPVPEFGWTLIRLSANPLFAGIPDPVCMVSHYDAVQQLPDDFKIIAATSVCQIHGFQYKDLPVWGVQFHPEYNSAEANEIFDKLSARDPGFSSYLSTGLEQEARRKLNEQIFLNFLASG
jgi:GMP synthase (glutamine-hydrolysing)